MNDPVSVLVALGGIAFGAQLQRFGFNREALSQLVKRGRILRLRVGVYALETLPSDIRAAALHGGMLTCVSALRHRGVWALPLNDAPHVWLGGKGHPRAHPGCTCISHFGRGSAGLGVVEVETALVHLHRCAGDEAFFASLESALRLRLISRSACTRIRDQLPSVSRWLIGFARADADSGLESLLRLRLHLIGISLETQVKIPGVGYVDFLAGGRLILEVDGREFHDGDIAWQRDRVRDAAASAQGYETLRFSYAQVIHDWMSVQAAVLAALSRVRDYA
ncbi:MAG: type IV toxin-antitoxin system AbiEi family antitoxin domain-containing protein [Microbacterium sp.]